MVMACFGQTRAASSHLRAQLLGRLFLEHVQEVVVAHLEHLGRDAHAQRVALTLVEVDDDLEAHGALPSQRRTSIALPRSAPGCASQYGRRGPRAGGPTRRRRRPSSGPRAANSPGREPVHDPPPLARALGQPRGFEHREVLHDGLARHRAAAPRSPPPSRARARAARRPGSASDRRARRRRGQARARASGPRSMPLDHGGGVEARLADAQQRADAPSRSSSTSTNDGASSPSAGTHQNDEPARRVDLLDHAHPLALGPVGPQPATGLGRQLDVVAEERRQRLPHLVGRRRQLDLALDARELRLCNSWVAH